VPVPDQIDVFFEEGKPPIVCRSLAEMDETLDRLHEECDPARPICVEVAIPGHRIDIGLGTDPTFICVQVEPCDGEHYLPTGDEAAEGWKDFYGCGNHTPFGRRNFVSLLMVRDALREFVEHQRLSGVIRWQDWAGRPA
jgi:hypothetical protein